MSKQCIVNFYAQVGMTQVVNITDENLTPEQLVEGLKKGELMTTLEHKFGQPVPTIVRFDEQGSAVPVAEILHQQVSDDSASYIDFELSE